VENQLDRCRALELWDLVGQEIFEIVAAAGVLTPAEIMPELRGETNRGAALHKEPLNPATPKKRMDVRISHDRYFEPRDAGRYARKIGRGRGSQSSSQKPAQAIKRRVLSPTSSR